MYDLSIVLKVTDQCNLHCPYCYYYAGEASVLRTRKFQDRDKRLNAFADALLSSDYAAGANKIALVLHGGEPLLVPVESIRRFLKKLNPLAEAERLFISLQTNGVLMDPKWVDLFEEFKISANVSIDGPAAIHDNNRPNAMGKGSYDDAVTGLRLLQKANVDKRITPPAILAVYTEGVSGGEYFNHFVKKLGIKNYDILFPDDALNNVETLGGVVESYKKMTQETWKAWLINDDPSIKIRFLHYAIKAVGLTQPAFSYDNQRVVVVDLKGDMFFEDALRTTMSLERLHVGNWIDDSFDQAMKEIDLISEEAVKPPKGCEDCSYLSICGGGEIPQRYVYADGTFGRPPTCSIYKSNFDYAYHVFKKYNSAVNIKV